MNQNEFQQIATYPIKRLTFDFTTIEQYFRINEIIFILNKFPLLEEINMIDSIEIQRAFFNPAIGAKRLKTIRFHYHAYQVDYANLLRHEVEKYIICIEPLHSPIDATNMRNLLHTICTRERKDSKIVIDRIEVWSTSEEAILRFYDLVEYAQEVFTDYNIEFRAWKDPRSFPGAKTKRNKNSREDTNKVKCKHFCCRFKK